MEIKVSLIKNNLGYFGVSYFDQSKKFVHFVMKTLDDCYSFVGKISNYQAELKISGRKFQVWSY